MRLLRCAAVTLAVLAMSWEPAAAAEKISSYALVNPDATLQVSGRVIQLFGIYVPPLQPPCRHRPDGCRTLAASALAFRIGSEFVWCRVIRRNVDRTVSASCALREGLDLGAYLIEHGFAFATAEAPPEYAILERVASNRAAGLWATPVPSYRRFRE